MITMKEKLNSAYEIQSKEDQRIFIDKFLDKNPKYDNKDSN
jgi:hypothetical protein